MVGHLIAALLPCLIVTQSRLTIPEGRSMLHCRDRPRRTLSVH
jgi:hypothetical protein